MSPSERLSLDASAEIDVAARRLMESTPCLSYSEAVRRVMAGSELLRAAYGGDRERVTLLQQDVRRVPRYPRPIASEGEVDRAKGEVLLLKLGPSSSGGGVFADRVG
jgi:hypothetical protein